MSKTRVIGYAIIGLLLLPLITFAQSQEMKEHKVIKGDTLWDITETELKDPFLWPKVWKENSWIANPDLIYPNQMIKVPLYLIQKEKSGEDAASKPETVSQDTAAAPKETAPTPQGSTTASELTAKEEVKKDVVEAVRKPLVNRNLLTASGYIADTVPGIGQIVGSPSKQYIFGNDDLVYVAVDRPTQVGEKFYVMKATGPVKHPTTGKEIGYVITIGGIAEIVKIINGETLAKITQCFGEMNKGDRLDAYYDIEPAIITGDFRSPNISGLIVATANGTTLQASLDVIYIDKGCKDGIEVGDIFKTFAVDAQTVPNGMIQVINCKDHTATAMIKKSNAPVLLGNIFAELDK